MTVVVRFPTERTRQTVGSATRRLDVALRGIAWAEQHREALAVMEQIAAAHEKQKRTR